MLGDTPNGQEKEQDLSAAIANVLGVDLENVSTIENHSGLSSKGFNAILNDGTRTFVKVCVDRSKVQEFNTEAEFVRAYHAMHETPVKIGQRLEGENRTLAHSIPSDTKLRIPKLLASYPWHDCKNGILVFEDLIDQGYEHSELDNILVKCPGDTETLMTALADFHVTVRDIHLKGPLHDDSSVCLSRSAYGDYWRLILEQRDEFDEQGPSHWRTQTLETVLDETYGRPTGLEWLYDRVREYFGWYSLLRGTLVQRLGTRFLIHGDLFVRNLMVRRDQNSDEIVNVALVDFANVHLGSQSAEAVELYAHAADGPESTNEEYERAKHTYDLRIAGLLGRREGWDECNAEGHESLSQVLPDQMKGEQNKVDLDGAPIACNPITEKWGIVQILRSMSDATVWLEHPSGFTRQKWLTTTDRFLKRYYELDQL